MQHGSIEGNRMSSTMTPLYDEKQIYALNLYHSLDKYWPSASYLKIRVVFLPSYLKKKKTKQKQKQKNTQGSL